MTKQNLEIMEFEDKKTQAGKRYTRFKTDDGWMSCFDKESCEKLKEQEGKIISCDVIEQGNFKNIKKFLGAESEDNEPAQEKKPSSAITNNKFESFPTSMKVSYAKDLIIAGKSQEEAVKIVKDLTEAFTPKVEVPKVIRNFKKEIVMLLQKGGADGMEISTIKENLKMTDEEVKEEITKLLEDGILYEPKPNLIKFLG